MPSIGSGVREIRAKDVSGIYRAVYVTKIAGKVHVLLAFQKRRPRKTSTSRSNAFVKSPEEGEDRMVNTQEFASVWDALYNDPIQARAMERCSLLMFEVQDWIEKGKWSQAEVAKKLGITQPRASELINSKVDKFSLEALLGFLDKIGADVQIKVDKPKKAA